MSERSDMVKIKESLPEKHRDIAAIAPLVDIFENEEEILLHADMPGVDKKDISINVDNGKLALGGIRKIDTGGASQWEEFANAVEYQRTFSVPQSIDVDKIKAELKDGVLCLHLPKSEAAKPRRIEIKTS